MDDDLRNKLGKIKQLSAAINGAITRKLRIETLKKDNCSSGYAISNVYLTGEENSKEKQMGY